MDHGLAAFFANLARGLGKILHLSGKLIRGRSYDSSVFRFPVRNIIKGLFHIAGKIILDEGEMSAEAGDNLFAQGRGHKEAFFRGDLFPRRNSVYDSRVG